MAFLELAEGAAINVILLFGFVALFSMIRNWPIARLSSAPPWVNGLIFGAMATVAMTVPSIVRPGLIFDSRSGMIGAAAFLGGPWCALASLPLPCLYRLHVGGPGVVPGLMEILFPAVLGALCHRLRHLDRRDPSVSEAILSSLVVGMFSNGLIVVSILAFMPDHGLMPGVGSSILVILNGPVSMALFSALLVLERQHFESRDALLASEDKYRQLVETTGTGYVILDGQGCVVDANPEYVRLTGRERTEDVVGHRVTEWTAEHDRERNALEVRKCVATGKVCGLEIDYTSPSGQIRPIEINAIRLHSSGDLRILTLCRDITERKSAEKEKYLLQAQLAQAHKLESIGRLAGSVAHDYNNMLAVILGEAELLIDKLMPGSEMHSEVLSIQKAALRSADLTRQLLAFARQRSVAPQIMDLNEKIGADLELLRHLVGAGIHLRWAPAADLDPVRMDPVQLNQILANLCVNARDAFDRPGGTIDIRTRQVDLDAEFCSAHAGVVPGRYAMFSVGDDGCGMDKETMAKIFEPFFTTKTVNKGTGMGLAIVYGAVEQNHGCIVVESEPGRGSTFSVYLPACTGKDRTAST